MKTRPRLAPPTPEEVEAALDRLSPFRLAEAWDNVGVLLATSRKSLGRILLTIDLTERVLDEAIAKRADGIVAYHPPIFAPLKRLADRDRVERTIRRAAAENLWIASPHTALAAAPNGLNDWLVGLAGKGRVEALRPASIARPTEAFKIVTYVSTPSVDAVRAAMSQVGAGRIGDYSECAFSSDGTGTFLGGASTQPVVGSRGRLERVEESRLEMVCGAASLAAAIESLRASHPYEEPPIEVHALQPPPRVDAGAGRVMHLVKPTDLASLAKSFCRGLELSRIDVAEAKHGRAKQRVARIGVCAGSGGDLLDAAIEQGCDAFLTGELSHHRVLDAVSRGLSILLVGHTESERGYLPTLAKRFKQASPGLETVVSKADRPPLQTIVDR
ncbi:MAG: Nif3-like dinuclear metal center hexameric protein [Phycisphaerales bacterium]